jgi:hypothetical protein
MASKRTARAADESVDAYLDALQHPYKKGVQVLRKAILSIDASIQEQVKWNAPSFRLEDHFATFRLHPGTMFQLILHTGAKVKASPKQFHLDAPPGFLKWATKDRCIVVFESDSDATTKTATVKNVVKE